MLVIGEEQMNAMEHIMMTHFIDITLDFLKLNFPEWISNRTDAALTSFIWDMIHFAQEHDIRSEISIQKLIAYKILYQYPIPLSPQLDFVLTRAGLAEGSRLEYFKRQVEDLSPLIKVTLEDATELWP